MTSSLCRKNRSRRRQRQRQRWQRKASRRKKGSQNPKKAYRKAARYQQYEKYVQSEYAHQTSHHLVAQAAVAVYVFGHLRIDQMTKRPKAKKDAQGRFLPNGAKAKAGLNQAILSLAWGQVVALTTDKALRRGQLVITVPPRIVHRNVRFAPSLPRTIGQPKPRFPQDCRVAGRRRSLGGRSLRFRLFR